MPETLAEVAAMSTCFLVVGLLGWWLLFRTPGVLEAAVAVGAIGAGVVHLLEDTPSAHL